MGCNRSLVLWGIYGEKGDGKGGGKEEKKVNAGKGRERRWRELLPIRYCSSKRVLNAAPMNLSLLTKLNCSSFLFLPLPYSAPPPKPQILIFKIIRQIFCNFSITILVTVGGYSELGALRLITENRICIKSSQLSDAKSSKTICWIAESLHEGTTQKGEGLQSISL